MILKMEANSIRQSPSLYAPGGSRSFKKSVTRKSLQVHAKAQERAELDERRAGDGADAGQGELLAPEREVERDPGGDEDAADVEAIEDAPGERRRRR